jgi:hypothetical protein
MHLIGKLAGLGRGRCKSHAGAKLQQVFPRGHMCIIQHPSSLAFSTCHMAIPCGQHYVAKHFVYNMWPLPFVNIMWPLATTLCQRYVATALCQHYVATTVPQRLFITALQ